MEINLYTFPLLPAIKSIGIFFNVIPSQLIGTEFLCTVRQWVSED